MSRTITGAIMLFLGLFLIIVPFLWWFKEGFFVAWIYGIPIFIIALFILLNKKEDKIERRKDK
jgi:archaellum biogenesis protein FlaJ (TadC family)